MHVGQVVQVVNAVELGATGRSDMVEIPRKQPLNARQRANRNMAGVILMVACEHARADIELGKLNHVFGERQDGRVGEGHLEEFAGLLITPVGLHRRDAGSHKAHLTFVHELPELAGRCALIVSEGVVGDEHRRFHINRVVRSGFWSWKFTRGNVLHRRAAYTRRGESFKTLSVTRSVFGVRYPCTALDSPLTPPPQALPPVPSVP